MGDVSVECEGHVSKVKSQWPVLQLLVKPGGLLKT